MPAPSEHLVALDALIPLFLEQFAAGKSVRFSPRGVSMLPMLRQGIDSVVLSPPPKTLKKYDLPLYRRKNGQYVLHRIIKVQETYTCMGDNQFSPENGIRDKQMIALVTGFYRGERYWSTHSFAYRCYCRLWHYTRLPRRAFRYLKRHLQHK